MPIEIFTCETGCYLDNHRGHYISRDVIDLAARTAAKPAVHDATT